MADEHWATFSIYDHRTPLYRQALVLFDRVVIPVPTSPFKQLGASEIDTLAADADYLESRGAAVRFDWDPQEFDAWTESVVSEALATTLSKDKQFATRLQLLGKVDTLIPPGVESVSAVPVYRSPEAHSATLDQLRPDVQERLTLEIVLKRIPVPAQTVGLDAILHLRDRPEFRESLSQLRSWMITILPQLLSDPSDVRLRAAGRDLDRWIEGYADAMRAANMDKLETAVTSILAIGALMVAGAQPLVAVMSSLASPLFSIRRILQPSWKMVSEKECAPAGVVYHAARIA